MLDCKHRKFGSGASGMRRCLRLTHGATPMPGCSRSRRGSQVCNAGPEAKPQLRILLDFCEASGVIARANGQITLAAVIGPPDLEQPLDSAAAVDPAPEPKPMPLAQPTKRTSDGGITYDISINVSMAEMKDWTPDRITAFFAGIAQVLAAKNG